MPANRSHHAVSPPVALWLVAECGNHIGAFLADPNGEGALALMLHVKRSEVAEMSALWSSTRRVL